MPLQNRVSPWSKIERTPHRGRLTGNRGILHGPDRELESKTWRSQAWIACVLEWRDWRRPVMTGRTWTELFFLDEAVALAAGHRPCAYCRREDFRRFVAAWARAFGEARRAPEMDRLLHRERVPIIRGHRPAVAASALPDGAFVEWNQEAWLIWRGRAHRWSFAGYDNATALHELASCKLLTAPSLVKVLENGYSLSAPPMV